MKLWGGSYLIGVVMMVLWWVVAVVGQSLFGVVMMILWWAVAVVGQSLFGVVMVILWWAVAMVGQSLVGVAGTVVGPAKAGWFPVWGWRSRGRTRRGIVGSC